MKPIFLTILFLVQLCLQAQIPNYSFESWRVVGNDTVIDGNWKGQEVKLKEEVVVYTQQGSASRSAYDGDKFVSISHKDSNQSGNIALGYLETKFAYNGRPKSFTFRGMYFPQLQGEGFAVVITTTKNNGDTICHTISSFGTISVTNWAALSTNLNYTTSTENPDSCYIRFQLLPTNNSTININTTLLADALRFNQFSVGVNETLENFGAPKNVTAYPNPANTATNIAFKLNSPATVQLSIYNIAGKQVYTAQKRFAAGKAKFSTNIAHLQQGIYTYTLKTSGHIKSGKLSILK